MHLLYVISRILKLLEVIKMEYLFKELSQRAFQILKSNEILTISLNGEESEFIRINKSKVRQITSVINGYASLELILGKQKASREFTFTKDNNLNFKLLKIELEKIRSYIKDLNEDPYIVKLSKDISSNTKIQGEIPKPDEIFDAVLKPLSKTDSSGIYSSGKIFRGISNSNNVFHWFETDNFSFDYSLIGKDEKMVKETYAGNNWDQDHFNNFIETSKMKLDSLKYNYVKLKPGKYKTYIAPAGIADIIDMFSWGGLSESSIRQGSSSFCKMRKEKLKLNHKFNLTEDFKLGLAPRFNSYGELSPENTELISNGILKNTLISSKSAKEYKIKGNKAEVNEALRSPVINPGELKNEKIIQTLRNGIYLSNLHYLNWSDRSNGRITGMTRYASFLVENGEIKAPIYQMRFDDSFYDFFGANLLSISDENMTSPNVSTYGGRSLGGSKCPGILIDNFRYTL